MGCVSREKLAQYIDQAPYTAKPIGRSQAERHESAEVEIACPIEDERQKKVNMIRCRHVVQYHQAISFLCLK
jgi:hypothetical protein